MQNKNQRVFVLRGVPGSGKSTFANFLRENIEDNIICSADDYFYLNNQGRYLWNKDKLGEAHKWCQTVFEQALANRVSLVIVDNTNITKREVLVYSKLAQEYGYEVTVLTVGSTDPRMADTYYEKNRHNVPKNVIVNMLERFEK